MQPSVTMVALYANRPEFAESILKVFRNQTYENKWLLIYNNGREPFTARLEPREALASDIGRTAAIGELRNLANTCSASDIIVHGDVDDWSHPNRISEQVALLQASGADVVGYNEMLFARYVQLSERDVYGPDGDEHKPCDVAEEAWLYTSPVPKPTLGTSLCYWRKTWKRKPFNPTLPNNRESLGEDTEFIRGLNAVAVSSVVHHAPKDLLERLNRGEDFLPRMIARIHGSNSTRYNIQDARGTSWKRVPEWDARVREILS